MDKHKDAALNKRTALEQLVALVATVRGPTCVPALTDARSAQHERSRPPPSLPMLRGVQARQLADQHGPFRERKVFPKYSI